MGIEPTQDGTSALLTVLKTAEPTRTLPPPHFGLLVQPVVIIHVLGPERKGEIIRRHVRL